MRRSLISTLFPVPAYLSLPAMGIDISDKAVKYVELVYKGRHIKLGSFGEIMLDKDVVVGGVIKDETKLSNAIREIVTKTHITFANASLPEEKAYLVDLEFPDIKSSDMQSTVELHLEENIPVEAVKTNFDYEELEGTTGGVVVSAIDAELVAGYERSLFTAGVVPVGLELESQAIARAVMSPQDASTIMILDIGRGQTNLSVASRGVVMFTSSIYIGGDAMTEAIMTDLSIDLKEASSLKEEVGLLNKSESKNPFNSIVRVATILRDELYQRMTYWDTSHKSKASMGKISRIIVCGGNAAIPGLLDYLSTGIALRVVVGNPWLNITDFKEYIPPIKAREATKYCTAIGLALRSMR